MLSEKYEQYEQANSKLFSVGVILGGMIFCLIISLCIYVISMFVAFAAWHCPPGKCEPRTLLDLTVFSLWLSPFLIFSLGAYLCRKSIFNLTTNKLWQTLLFMIFGLFPAFIIAGILVYIIISPN